MRPAFKKYRSLLHDLCPLERVVVAFSGGVDSTLLLAAAKQVHGDGVLAVTLDTPYMSRAAIEEAERTAAAMQVRHRVVRLPFPEELRDNPPDRCYRCKRRLFSLLTRLAAKDNIRHVLDGTNADDMRAYRPGLRALDECGIESPLRAAGLTKQEIRDIAKYRKLAWNKPADACLLSRLPHGVRVTEETLRRIDQAESVLRSLGFPAVRVRSHGDLARIEVPEAQVAKLVAANRNRAVRDRLAALGYRYVTVDLAGYRTGSLDEPGDKPQTA